MSAERHKTGAAGAPSIDIQALRARYRDERDELRELAGAFRVGCGQRVERDEDDEEDELERDLEPHSFSMAWNFSTLG